MGMAQYIERNIASLERQATLQNLPITWVTKKSFEYNMEASAFQEHAQCFIKEGNLFGSCTRSLIRFKKKKDGHARQGVVLRSMLPASCASPSYHMKK